MKLSRQRADRREKCPELISVIIKIPQKLEYIHNSPRPWHVENSVNFRANVVANTSEQEDDKRVDEQTNTARVARVPAVASHQGLLALFTCRTWLIHCCYCSSVFVRASNKRMGLFMTITQGMIYSACGTLRRTACKDAL